MFYNNNDVLIKSVSHALVSVWSECAFFHAIFSLIAFYCSGDYKKILRQSKDHPDHSKALFSEFFIKFIYSVYLIIHRTLKCPGWNRSSQLQGWIPRIFTLKRKAGAKYISTRTLCLPSHEQYCNIGLFVLRKYCTGESRRKMLELLT